jgi:hypothetical protein
MRRDTKRLEGEIQIDRYIARDLPWRWHNSANFVNDQANSPAIEKLTQHHYLRRLNATTTAKMGALKYVEGLYYLYLLRIKQC